MNSTEVNISITSKQYDGDRLADTIEVKNIGSLYAKNGSTYIVYYEEEGEIKILNTIKFNKDELTMKKMGAINTLMRFREGVDTSTNYRTSQGVFLIETSTKILDINNEGNGNIKIYIDYNIEIQDLFTGRNSIQIEINKIN
ncbi:MAG: DUF1934 domain-containing protein [Clostridioides sp.]|jgi:uncharacterized beta-barrel protein YwiB (DUF1934 family)|nr:DUF1934 domain-containing protein [Clostridioides sp.]